MPVPTLVGELGGGGRGLSMHLAGQRAPGRSTRTIALCSTTIAAERLAVIAAVTLPITALSSVVGMNVIVNDETRAGPLALLLVIMLIMSSMLLVWAHRKGWW